MRCNEKKPRFHPRLGRAFCSEVFIMQLIKNLEKSIVLVPETDRDIFFLEYLSALIESHCSQVMPLPVSGGYSLPTVDAIGIPFDQTQSSFCPHWTPPESTTP
jgi:hypothetical protein